MDFTSSSALHNYSINKLNIMNNGLFADVSTSFINIEIFESLGGLISGSLVLSDTHSLTDFLSMRGQESVEIEFKNNSSESYFSKTFTVTNIARTINKINTSEVLVITFASDLLVRNKQEKVVISEQSETVSRIVQNVLESLTDEPLNIEATSFPRDFTTGYIKPLNAVHTLKHVAYNNNGIFEFFENRDGLNFVSLNSLKQAIPRYTIFSSPVTSEALSIANENELDAIRVSVKTLNNKETLSAVQGARSVSHSMINKSFSAHDTREDDIVPMNDTLLFDQEREYRNQPLNNIQLMSADGFYKSDHKNEYGHFANKGAVEKAYSFAREIVVEISGCTDLTVGDVVELEYTNTAMTTTNNLSGKYLITELKHEISDNGFMTTVELATDSERVQPNS